MPLASWAAQMGEMARRAFLVSRHDEPAREPLSSIRKTVSKLERKAYGSSGEVMLGLDMAEDPEGAGEGWRGGGGEVSVMAGAAVVGAKGSATAVYGGGGASLVP